MRFNKVNNEHIYYTLKKPNVNLDAKMSSNFGHFRI